VNPNAANRFRACFAGLAKIGRNPRTGGLNRLAWTAEDAEARAWFVVQAESAGLAVERDANGNLWAWWDPVGSTGPAIATGSHLDTVPDGGAYDGALGVVSALVAVEELQREGVRPIRPLAVVAFADEEGARFGTPTFGSRLLTGALDPASVLDRTDRQGVRLADALDGAGIKAAGTGPEPARLGRLAAFVELHVEQGRALVDEERSLGVATGIWPHGRWALTVIGEANHAGTTRMEDRRDPMTVLAAAVTAARDRALGAGGVATVGRVLVAPNGTNSIPARVRAWLDARAPDSPRLDALVDGWSADVAAAAEREGVEARVTEESRTPGVSFDSALSDQVAASLSKAGADPPFLPTAAGHDAGALAAAVPSTMLFVRNPTGVSHSPAEHADEADCLAGVAALRTVLEDLVCR
jgi:beta-ureidopropionase / N-carbamoyl-L-amino-acid hydrolase